MFKEMRRKPRHLHQGKASSRKLLMRALQLWRLSARNREARPLVPLNFGDCPFGTNCTINASNLSARIVIIIVDQSITVWGCITPAHHVVQQVIIIGHEMLKLVNRNWRTANQKPQPLARNHFFEASFMLPMQATASSCLRSTAAAEFRKHG